jgi:hypothetical protein
MFQLSRSLPMNTGVAPMYRFALAANVKVAAQTWSPDPTSKMLDAK